MPRIRIPLELTPAESATLHTLLHIGLQHASKDPLLRSLHEKVKSVEEAAAEEHGVEAMAHAIKAEVQEALNQAKAEASLGEIQGPLL